MPQIKHVHHRYHLTYTSTLKRHLSSGLVAVGIFSILLLLAFNYIFPGSKLNLFNLSPADIFYASVYTTLRLATAYFLAVVFAIPLALLITSSQKTEKVLLPIFDILQSVPVLAFFPVIVLLFIRLQLYDGAAIFVLFMAMLWNLVFSMIGGLKSLPEDVKDAAVVFQLSGFYKLRYITLPAIFPYLITGSLLGWGEGWSIVIVAEVLHNYIPTAGPDQDLFGLGSMLVNSSYQGNTGQFIVTIIVMMIVIGLLNLLVWQKLLRLTERYKFD